MFLLLFLVCDSIGNSINSVFKFRHLFYVIKECLYNVLELNLIEIFIDFLLQTIKQYHDPKASERQKTAQIDHF